MKIAICIPHSYENFQKPFTKSLLGLVSSFYIWNNSISSPHSIELYIQDEGYIDFMRERLAEVAIAKGADYLLWLDTDMTFPLDIIERMIKRFEEEGELEAVTGLYVHKTPPFMPHTYSSITEEGTFKVAAGFPLNEPFGVEGAGFGALMIKASVFTRTPKPWFEFTYPTPTTKGKGEDLTFFLKAQPINMICDPTISCRHYLQNGFDISHYVKYNNLLVLSDVIEPTEEQVKHIVDEMYGSK